MGYRWHLQAVSGIVGDGKNFNQNFKNLGETQVDPTHTNLPPHLKTHNPTFIPYFFIFFSLPPKFKLSNSP